MTHLTHAEKQALLADIKRTVYAALLPVTVHHRDADTCSWCYGKCEAAALIDVLADSIAITASLVTEPQALVDKTLELIAVAIAHARDVQAAKPAPLEPANPKETVH